MSSIIVGTAGHIDHGKTSLIKALNGVDGDRMASEKERGITIDLSFSNLKSGENNIAFIDVPGHENLVKTMISGAYAYDAALLVVAANDSIMPQTKEHLEVLEILGVKALILCITKTDLVSKDKALEVEKESLEFISNFKEISVLKSFFISIKDENSVLELKNYLFNIKPKARDEGFLTRYYIDRVFSIKGAGTIVTGSLIEGVIKKNERLFNLDTNKILLIKSVQVHDEFREFATSPNRVALNLADASVSELKKGQILSKKGFFRGFKEVDALFKGGISHGSEVIFCVGSKSVTAKALIISQKDDSKFISFKFNETMFLKFDEPFVVLENSRVIGGGRVLNPVSEPLKKPAKIELLIALKNRNFKKAFEILTASHKHGFGLISSLQRFNLTHEKALEIAKTVSNLAYLDEENLCIYPAGAVEDLKNFIKFIIEKNEFAILSASSVSLRLSWVSESFANYALEALKKSEILDKNGALFTKKEVDFESVKTGLNSKIYEILAKSGLSPDAPYNIYDALDIDRQTGDNALKSLTRSKKVIRLAHNLFVTVENLNLAMKSLRDIIKTDGKVGVQNAKDRLNLSRKFAIAYLEYLDNFEDILKIDNDRVLKI